MFKTTLVALLPLSALAAVHNVNVGMGGLVFQPDSITAAMGDTINWHFYPGDHSVAQANFKLPCFPSGPKALFSNFFTPSSGVDSMMFATIVNSTDPMWLYCSQGDHCQEGMVMVVNPPTSGPETITTFKALAGKAKGNVSPKMVSGGVRVANSNNALTAMSASMMSTATMTGSMTSMSGSMTSMSGSMMTTGTMTATAAAMSTSNAAQNFKSVEMGLPGAMVAAAGVLGAWGMI